MRDFLDPNDKVLTSTMSIKFIAYLSEGTSEAKRGQPETWEGNYGQPSEGTSLERWVMFHWCSSFLWLEWTKGEKEGGAEAAQAST